MSLVRDTRHEGPEIHALVIGVGGYDYLTGGTGRHTLSRSKYGDLGQLTSPAVSACGFAQHLIDSAHLDWLAPLGTVDLLVSVAPNQAEPALPGGPYQRATRDAIQDAFDDWWARCNEHEGNVAVFFFCGHGLQATNQVLLAADFGRSQNNPWAHSFDFNKTRQAFRANRAHAQIFFVDACREITTSTVEVPSPNSPPLREPERRDPERCRHDLTVQSTSRTMKAYGPESEPSYFTAGLLDALRGGASKKEDGSWWIRTDMISSRIKTMVRLAGGGDQTPVVSSSEPVRLCRIDGVPEATLELACAPEEATGHASFAVWPLGGGARTSRPEKASAPWAVQLRAGFYGVSAEFDGVEYRNTIDEVAVEPPLTPERLRVQ